MLAQLVRQIASLQTQYSSENTPEMAARGVLIRRDVPRALGVYRSLFTERLKTHGPHMMIEGSDGIGRKTQAPWVRIASRDLSPSATTGFYMVIHFAVAGDRCFVTVGCGATRWDNEKGDLVRVSDAELRTKVLWARGVLANTGIDCSMFADTIDIGSQHALPHSFEKATVLCQTHSVAGLSDESLVASISEALARLAVVYDHFSQLADLKPEEIAAIDVESVVNPQRRDANSRQGYGLSSPERRAVEQRAMECAREYLLGQGYSVKDVSAKCSYDFLAARESEQIKVEVKGTTSNQADAVMMTAREVSLHSSGAEKTALAIVSSITLVQRGERPQCSGGTLEFIYPWDIGRWECVPTAYIVRRRSEVSGDSVGERP
jgi:hypothetical protein